MFAPATEGVVRAEIYSLVRILEVVFAEIPALKEESAMGAFAKVRKDQLERLILSIGDTNPTIAERLQQALSESGEDLAG